MKWWRRERLNQPYWKLSSNRDWRNRSTWHQRLPPLQLGLVDRFLCRHLPVSPAATEGTVSYNHPSQIRHPHQLTLHHRAWGDSRLCLRSDFWVGRGLERHPVPPRCPPALCPCRGVACASAPQAHICYMFPSGISKGPQRIPRILDTGISWGSPIIRSASRVCATRISFTAF